MVDYHTGVKWQMIDNQWRVAHVDDQDPNIVTDEKIQKKFREAAEQCERAAEEEARRKQLRAERDQAERERAEQAAPYSGW